MKYLKRIYLSISDICITYYMSMFLKIKKYQENKY